MNRCDQCMENLSSYIDGELSSDQAEIIEEHLKECDSCANELAVLKTIISACSELEEELPEGFEASLHKRLEKAKEEAQAKRNTSGRIRMYSQIAAGFVLILALGFVVRSGIFNSTKLSGNAGLYDITAPQSADEASLESGNTASLKMAAARRMPSESPESSESPQETGSLNAGVGSFSGGMQKSDIKIAEEDTGKGSITFSESRYAGSFIIDGQDTVVRIKTVDIGKAYESIVAIDKKLESSGGQGIIDNTGTAYTIEADIKEPVELKLFYKDDEKWQEFLSEMQSIFPEMKVESAPASEEQEYIRVFIEKE